MKKIPNNREVYYEDPEVSKKMRKMFSNTKMKSFFLRTLTKKYFEKEERKITK